MQLFLARHGETTANRQGIILGRTDAPLTPLGIETARRLSGILEGEPIREILASPLGRTMASAMIIAGRIGVTPIPTHRLIELSCGQWEGRNREKFLCGGKTLRSTWTGRPPGGESCMDAEPRVMELIDTILEQFDGDSILLVGHAVVNRVFLKIWCELAADLANRLVQPHDMVYVLSGDTPIRWLRADGSTGTGLQYSIE